MSDPTIPAIGIFGANALAELAGKDSTTYTAALAGFVHGLVKPSDLIPGRLSRLVDNRADLIGQLIEAGIDPSAADLQRWQAAINTQVMGDADDAAADLVAADDPKSPPVPSPI